LGQIIDEKRKEIERNMGEIKDSPTKSGLDMGLIERMKQKRREQINQL
jgi:hypothetical protein